MSDPRVVTNEVWQKRFTPEEMNKLLEELNGKPYWERCKNTFGHFAEVSKVYGFDNDYEDKEKRRLRLLYNIYRCTILRGETCTWMSTQYDNYPTGCPNCAFALAHQMKLVEYK